MSRFRRQRAGDERDGGRHGNRATDERAVDQQLHQQHMVQRQRSSSNGSHSSSYRYRNNPPPPPRPRKETTCTPNEYLKHLSSTSTNYGGTATPFGIPQTSLLSPRSDTWLYLFLSSICSAASLSVATPPEYRSSIEKASLGMIGLSIVLTFGVGVMWRYASSRVFLTSTSIRLLGGTLSNTIISVEYLLAGVSFALWSTISGLVLSNPTSSSDTDGGVYNAPLGTASTSSTPLSIWNANLYFSTWLSFALSSVIMADLMTVDTVVGLLPRGYNLRNNALGKSWLLYFVASAGLVGFSSQSMRSSYCSSGGGTLATETVCRHVVLGVLFGVLGMVLCGGYFVLGFLSRQQDRSPYFHGGNLKNSTQLSLGSLLSFTTLVCSAINVGFMTSPNGPGSEPCNIYFSSWILFGLSVNLCLRYLEVYLVPGVLADNGGLFRVTSGGNGRNGLDVDAGRLLMRRKSTESTVASSVGSLHSSDNDRRRQAIVPANFDADTVLESMVASDSSEPVLYLNMNKSVDASSIDDISYPSAMGGHQPYAMPPHLQQPLPSRGGGGAPDPSIAWAGNVNNSPDPEESSAEQIDSMPQAPLSSSDSSPGFTGRRRRPESGGGRAKMKKSIHASEFLDVVLDDTGADNEASSRPSIGSVIRGQRDLPLPHRQQAEPEPGSRNSFVGSRRTSVDTKTGSLTGSKRASLISLFDAPPTNRRASVETMPNERMQDSSTLEDSEDTVPPPQQQQKQGYSQSMNTMKTRSPSTSDEMVAQAVASSFARSSRSKSPGNSRRRKRRSKSRESGIVSSSSHGRMSSKSKSKSPSRSSSRQRGGGGSSGNKRGKTPVSSKAVSCGSHGPPTLSDDDEDEMYQYHRARSGFTSGPPTMSASGDSTDIEDEKEISPKGERPLRTINSSSTVSCVSEPTIEGFEPQDNILPPPTMSSLEAVGSNHREAAMTAAAISGSLRLSKKSINSAASSQTDDNHRQGAVDKMVAEALKQAQAARQQSINSRSSSGRRKNQQPNEEHHTSSGTNPQQNSQRGFSGRQSQTESRRSGSRGKGGDGRSIHSFFSENDGGSGTQHSLDKEQSEAFAC